MAESALIAAAAKLASGGADTPATPEPVEAEEATQEPVEGEEAPAEAKGEGEEASEAEEKAEKKDDDEDEDLDDDKFKARKAQIDKAYARLNTKKRETARQIQAARAELERERATIKREREAASQYLQSSVSKIEKFDRLVELAKSGDDALIDELGIDLEKLTLRYLERGTPAAADRKAKSEVEALKAEIAAEKAARAEAERKEQERQHQAWRADQSRQFVQFAVSKSDVYPLSAVAAEDDPEEVATLAWRVRDLAVEQGIELDTEGILAEVEFHYDVLAQRQKRRQSKIQARRLSPMGSQDTPQKPARGLASGPRRQPAASPRNTESLSESERLSLAARMLRQATRSST